MLNITISSIKHTLEGLYRQAKVSGLEKQAVMTKMNFILEQIIPRDWGIIADEEYSLCKQKWEYLKISAKCRSHFEQVEYPKDCKLFEILTQYERFLEYDMGGVSS